MEAENLTWLFGQHKARDQLSRDVEQGEVFGVLGPNGAGKIQPGAPA